MLPTVHCTSIPKGIGVRGGRSGAADAQRATVPQRCGAARGGARGDPNGAAPRGRGKQQNWRKLWDFPGKTWDFTDGKALGFYMM